MSEHSTLPPIPHYAPKRGTRWQHLRSGDHYGILAVGYSEIDVSFVVVYTRAQTVWVRPLESFLGRFRPDDLPICGSSQVSPPSLPSGT